MILEGSNEEKMEAYIFIDSCILWKLFSLSTFRDAIKTKDLMLPKPSG